MTAAGSAPYAAVPDDRYLVRRRPRVQTWPLGLLLAGYPLLWLSGVAFVAAPLLAVPMVWELARRRRLRVPAGFGFYLVLLAVLLMSVVMLTEHAPGTLPRDVGIGRYLAWGVRLSDYLLAAVVLLFVGNLSEKELPTARVVRWLAAFFTVTVIGGSVSLVLPPVEFTAPGQHLLPQAIAEHRFVQDLTTVSFAQWHAIVGDELAPRPAAPFTWTNIWGYMLALLLPWFVVGGVLATRTAWRWLAAVAVLGLALVPVVYSLNRGLWVGLMVLAGYIMLRLFRRGTLVPVAVMLAVVAVLGVATLASPLAGVLQQRWDSPHSNDTRIALGISAVGVAQSSPLLGYGGQLTTIGSGESIAVGASADCPLCGNREIGAEGQLWQLLVTTGFTGTLCYLAFFARFWWRYRRHHSPVGIAGGANLCLTMLYLPLYTALGMPLVVTMVGMGLWWRQATAGQWQEER